MKRRHLVRAAEPALALPGLPWVRAQPAWPTQPVRLRIAFTAGGVPGLRMREMAVNTGWIVGKSAVGGNRPGAGGTLPGRQPRFAEDAHRREKILVEKLGLARPG